MGRAYVHAALVAAHVVAVAVAAVHVAVIHCDFWTGEGREGSATAVGSFRARVYAGNRITNLAM